MAVGNVLGRMIYELVMDTGELEKGADRAKKELSEVATAATASSSNMGSAVGAMSTKFMASVGIVTTLGAAAGKVIMDAVRSTQKLGDAYNREIEGLKSAYESFVRSLASGEGWRDLIRNMARSYETGRQVADILDEIFERQNSLSIVESKYAIAIAEANRQMRDTSLSDEERLAAADEVISKYQELGVAMEDIARQNADAAREVLRNATGMTDQEITFVIDNYNENRKVLQQAMDYLKESKRLEDEAEKARLAHQKTPGYLAAQWWDTKSRMEAAQRLKEEYEVNTEETVKWAAQAWEKYNRSNDEIVASYTQAVIDINRAQSGAIQSSIRANTTKGTITEEIRRRTESEVKAREDAAQTLSELERRLAMSVEEASIEGMVEGRARKLAEIELDRRRTIDAIDKEQKQIEDAARRAGRAISEDTSAAFETRRSLANTNAANRIKEVETETAEYLTDLYNRVGQAFMSEEAKKIEAVRSTYNALRTQLDTDLAGCTLSLEDYEALKARIDAAESKEITDTWVQTYGSYEQKLAALRTEWANRIKDIPAEFAEEANRQMNNAIANFIIDNSEAQTAVTRLFDDMAEKSVADLRAIHAEGERLYSFLAGGIWDADTGQVLGISEEQFNLLRQSPDELERIRKALNDIEDTANENDTAFNQMAEGLRQVFEAGDNATKLDRGLELVNEAVGKVSASLGVLQDAFANIADATGNKLMGGLADGLSATMNAMDSAMSGAQAGAIFGPWGAAAGAAIGAVSSLYNSIASLHDENIASRMENLQRDVDDLSRSYDEFSEKVSEAYGRNAIASLNDMNDNLARQNELIRQQIALEESKKNTDQNVIDQYNRALEENARRIQENRQVAADAIFGDDVRSAISSFADALTAAWEQGNNAASGARDFVRTMMRQVVNEAVRAYVQASGRLEEIREAVRSAMLDNVMSEEEVARIEGMAERLAGEIQSRYGWSQSIFGEDAGRTGLTGASGIAASQDSVNMLDARVTTIQEHTFSIVEGQRELIDMSARMLQQMTDIERNTRIAYQYVGELGDDVRRLRGTMDDMSLRGIRLKT